MRAPSISTSMRSFFYGEGPGLEVAKQQQTDDFGNLEKRINDLEVSFGWTRRVFSADHKANHSRLFVHGCNRIVEVPPR